jgi:O-antigen/teichoic acid export membrane protein
MITKSDIKISFATQYVELVIQFLAVLALARILSPEDIGAYSVAAFLMTLLHAFRDFGVVQYIIQERELTTQKIRSAMGVAILLAAAVALLMFASSGFVARFYDNPSLEQILVVMAASFAISPLGSLLVGIFRRESHLRKVFCAKIVSVLCHATVALLLAMNDFGALSLAWANFAGILSFGVVTTLMRPKGLPWLPQFSNIKDVLSFGSIATLGNAANNAGTNVPDIVLGKVMDMAAVGYFSRANGLVQLFTKLISGALLPLVLPHFSDIRRQGKEAAPYYISSVQYLTAFSWPFFAVMMLLAQPIVLTLYGPQWYPSVPVVELLCVAGALASLSAFAAHAMVANGEVRKSTTSQLIAQPFRIGSVVIGCHYGLIYVALALIVSECVTFVIVARYIQKTIRVGLLQVIRATQKSAVVALGSSIVPLGVKFFWAPYTEHHWMPLSIGIAGASAGWIISVFVTLHPLGIHLSSILEFVRLPFRSKGVDKKL